MRIRLWFLHRRTQNVQGWIHCRSRSTPLRLCEMSSWRWKIGRKNWFLCVLTLIFGNGRRFWEQSKRSRRNDCVLVCDSIFIRIYKKCTDHDVAGGLKEALIFQKYKSDVENEESFTFQHFRMFWLVTSSLANYCFHVKKAVLWRNNLASHDRLDSRKNDDLTFQSAFGATPALADGIHTQHENKI